MRDHRKQERLALIHHLRIFRQKSDQVLGYLGNITTKGLLVFTQQRVDSNLGAVLSLEMALPEPILGADTIAFQASSRWCERDKRTGLYATGFQIITIDPQDACILGAAMVQYRCHA